MSRRSLLLSGMLVLIAFGYWYSLQAPPSENRMIAAFRAVGLVSWVLPSDDKMIATFRANRAAFDQLAQMSIADKQDLGTSMWISTDEYDWVVGGVPKWVDQPLGYSGPAYPGSGYLPPMPTITPLPPEPTSALIAENERLGDARSANLPIASSGSASPDLERPVPTAMPDEPSAYPGPAYPGSQIPVPTPKSVGVSSDRRMEYEDLLRLAGLSSITTGVVRNAESSVSYAYLYLHNAPEKRFLYTQALLPVRVEGNANIYTFITPDFVSGYPVAECRAIEEHWYICTEINH